MKKKPYWLAGCLNLLQYVVSILGVYCEYIVSVLEEGYTVKYILSPRKIARAVPRDFPRASHNTDIINF